MMQSFCWWWFGCNVIRLTYFQMKLRSESKYYHFFALLPLSWPCKNNKYKIAFLFLYLAQELLCRFVFVYVRTHLIMAFAPKIAILQQR